MATSIANRSYGLNQLSFVLSVTSLELMAHLGEKRFHVFLRWRDPEFTVGVFAQVLAQKIKAFTYVADMGFVLGEAQPTFPEKASDCRENECLKVLESLHNTSLAVVLHFVEPGRSQNFSQSFSRSDLTPANCSSLSSADRLPLSNRVE